MSNMIPCNNPDVCGVVYHRPGTRCKGGFKPAPGTAAASRLKEAQDRLRTPPPSADAQAAPAREPSRKQKELNDIASRILQFNDKPRSQSRVASRASRLLSDAGYQELAGELKRTAARRDFDPNDKENNTRLRALAHRIKVEPIDEVGSTEYTPDWAVDKNGKKLRLGHTYRDMDNHKFYVSKKGTHDTDINTLVAWDEMNENGTWDPKLDGIQRMPL